MNTAFDTVSTKPKINILLSSKVHIILHSKIKQKEIRKTINKYTNTCVGRALTVSLSYKRN